jgi:antitoxin component YwqK of YwqJK toxin-antitoxin module
VMNAGPLVQMAVFDVLFGSTIEKRQNEWVYRQDNRIRAVVGVSDGVLQGEFTVFYPSGNVWLRGHYAGGVPIPDDWEVFLPDGTSVGSHVT